MSRRRRRATEPVSTSASTTTRPPTMCRPPANRRSAATSARRLGVTAKAREVRGADRVVVRDGDAIGALLTRMGAHESVMAWEERRMRREVRATANRLANFDDANMRRSARAAVAAGRLRAEHTQASLEELGQLADPPMTKDAVAGRIRRLLHMADKRAGDQGIPGTEANLTPDMLDA